MKMGITKMPTMKIFHFIHLKCDNHFASNPAAEEKYEHNN